MQKLLATIHERNHVAGFLASEEQLIEKKASQVAAIRKADLLEDLSKRAQMFGPQNARLQNLELIMGKNMRELLGKRQPNRQLLEVLFAVFDSQHDTIVEALAEKLGNPDLGPNVAHEPARNSRPSTEQTEHSAASIVAPNCSIADD